MNFNKIFLLVIVIFIVSFAQSISIVEPITLLAEGNEQYLMPRISPDGNFVAFGGENHQGIYLIDYKGLNKTKISNELAAGWNIQWSPKSNELATRENYYNAEIKSKLSAVVLYDINGNKYSLTEKVNDISMPAWNFDGSKVYYISAIGLVTNSKISESTTDEFFFIDNNKFISSKNFSCMPELNSNIKGTILTAVWSPNKSKLAIEVAGFGLLIWDCNTSKLYDFGEGEAPSWINNEYLTYMLTRDDGYRILSSEIYIRKYDGSDIQNLTVDFDEPAYYPSSSLDGRIVFNSESGKIYKIKIEIK